MPELPEVETVRKVLARHLVGKRVLSLDVPKVNFNRKADPKKLKDAAVGRTLQKIDRRGKYLIMMFEGGKEVILHLGMSGRLLLKATSKWTRLTMTFEHTVLTFEDPRRFGFAQVDRPELGPEPLDAAFRVETLRAALKGRKAPIHAVLLDQQTVAGVGNIYSTEALAAAGIRPGRRAASLTAAEVGKLHKTLVATLTRAVEEGGSTLEDDGYKDPEGESGSMQDRLRVYGREDCGTCGGKIHQARKQLAGRTARFCPRCQK